MEEQKKELASTTRGMENAKVRQLDMYTASTDGPMTNDEGIKLTTTTETLKVGPRGPTLIQDFNFREKITRFDHERIPERVVHARGAAAHGYFQVYKSLSDVTRARFLTDTSLKTPVFVRFSTVLGSRGSPDTVRDVRGFATRFYTPEGNFDLVGNNIPVFFIQDAMQFPDLIHAGKPEPQNEIPQAQTAHDNFWDFISLTPEAMHMIMWTLSDRAIPKSFATMEGFGVNTFRLINEKGEAHFVKWHWLPVLGTASLVWDEALKISGKDPDYHRRQMFESIEKGIPFEYELGLQIFDEAQAAKFDFDILDCTKIVPEELVPIHKVGRMVLNRNVDNYFAETEQVAFCVHNLVPGIDVSDDPLLHGRMHSYFDTQLTRLGGPNFTEIPINQPICPVYNFNQDGFGRQRIIKGNVNYWPNSRGGGCPFMSSIKQGGYVPFPAQISGPKIAVRSDSFKDHYTQARMFYHSLTEIEQMHLLDAASFEWGKVADLNIRQRMLDHLSKITLHGARYVAEKLSLPTPTEGFTGDVRYTNISIERRKQPSVKGRKIAVLVSDGFNLSQVNAVKAVLEEGGATVNLVGIRASHLDDAKEKQACDFTFETAGSVLFDGFFIPGGAHAVKLCQTGNAIFWINEAYKHCKPIAAVEEGVDLIRRSAIRGVRLAEGDSSDFVEDKGVVTLRNALDARGVISTLKRAALPPSFVETFVTAIGAHRHWSRVLSDPVNFDSIPV